MNIINIIIINSIIVVITAITNHAFDDQYAMILTPDMIWRCLLPVCLSRMIKPATPAGTKAKEIVTAMPTMVLE